MKKNLFGIFILGVTLSCKIENDRPAGENGKLTGVVTYKEAYEPANMADAGCEIYAIDEAGVRSTKYDEISAVIDNFQRNKSDYSMSINNTIDPARVKNLQDNFDTLSGFTNRYIRGFKQLPAVIRAATNRTGNYTLSLKPGRYYILVISGSVKSNNIAELKGNIDYELVNVRSAGETFVDFNFKEHETVMPRTLSGC